MPEEPSVKKNRTTCERRALAFIASDRDILPDIVNRRNVNAKEVAGPE
jgi:hypothetical protein